MKFSNKKLQTLLYCILNHLGMDHECDGHIYKQTDGQTCVIILHYCALKIAE